MPGDVIPPPSCGPATDTTRSKPAYRWRDRFLGSLVILGVLVTLITEGLSLAGQLQRVPLIVLWCLVAAGAGVLGYRRWRPPEFSAPQVLDAICILGIAAIVSIIGFIAWVSPPNSTDAMAYHMPRVIYWAQQHSVKFFPTPYLNQIMLQPLAEYFMLHTYLLSGGDHFVNVVQWMAMFGSVVGVSLTAQLFGAARRGQILAALFCATLPNGILQASGAKNDYLLALWLVAMVYFAMRFIETSERADLVYCGCSLGLALLTKATAYLFVPGILLAIAYARGSVSRILPSHDREGVVIRLLRTSWILAACAVLINAPQYARNINLSGSPLGFDSAQGDGFFRWRNERFGWRQIASNLLRNVADQMGARRDTWNQGVYNAVVTAHGWMHADVNDPDTTWRWTKYKPPRNSNHETNANNSWHLLILAGVAIAAAMRRQRIIYLLGLVLGFILFCFYLKWQPFEARLFLPLFVLAAPVAGVELERLRPVLLQWLLCLFLLNNSRPYLFENWVRPLKGPNSILNTSREDQYFSDLGQWHNRESYLDAVQTVRAMDCGTVGIDINNYALEYPFQVLLRAAKPAVRFVHTGVHNASAKYSSGEATQACVELCMNCASGKFVLTVP